MQRHQNVRTYRVPIGETAQAVIDQAITKGMDWKDPVARAALIEQIGVAGYNGALRDHMAKSTVATINGRDVRTVGSRFGVIYMVDGTSNGFQTQLAAETWCKANPL